MDKEVVVRYQGHELWKPDLEFLKGPCYVTDRMIDFYFSFLSDKFGTEDEILLVPPSISRWLGLCKDPQDIAGFVSHLDLPSRQLVLFPVNNDVAMGGVESTLSHTHWSLLVYDATTQYFLHFDDKRMGAFFNGLFAGKVYRNVKSLVPWRKGRGQEQPRPPKLRRVTTAELDKGFNLYDCGIHVMAEAKIICEWYVSFVDQWNKYGPCLPDMPTYLHLIIGMDVSVEKNTRSEVKNVIERITGKNLKELLL